MTILVVNEGYKYVLFYSLAQKGILAADFLGQEDLRKQTENIMQLLTLVGDSILGGDNSPEVQNDGQGDINSGTHSNSNIPKMANRGHTGRTQPNSLNEQLAMKQVMSDPLSGASAVPLQMSDPRWLGSDGWVKMQNIVTLSDKTVINIHFVYNSKLNLVDDFKFK